VADSNHPHDALFKKTFSEVEHAAAGFRAVLPAQLVALTDFATGALCPAPSTRPSPPPTQISSSRLKSPADLDRWLDRVLSADKLEALLDS